MKIDNFKIGSRLIAAFGIVLLMLVAMAAVGVSRMAAIQNAMVDITKGNNVESSLASDMRLSVDDRMIALRNIVLLNDAAEMRAQVERVQVQARNYADAETKLRATFAAFGIQDEESKLLEGIQRQGALALPLIAVTPDALRAMETPTRSAVSLAARDTGSVAEAAALAAAGEGAWLIASRRISPDRMATCAIAQGLCS